MKRRLFASVLMLITFATVASAQMGYLTNQHYYKKNVPAGNYSGLANIGGNE